MFQKYSFQFGSIGDFRRPATSRADLSSVASPTGSGSWGKQARYTGSGSGAPIAVFRFQDFDDMVARMREQSTAQTSS